MACATSVPLAPPHAEIAAAIHAAAMAAGTGDAAWDAAAIGGLLGLPGTFGFLALVEEGPAGFVLVRAAAGEAEILTLAVRPQLQRRGVARDLLRSACAGARERAAARLLLEVAEDNAPARGLYAGLGFVSVGRRAGYYGRPGRPAMDCLVLELRLGEASALAEG